MRERHMKYGNYKIFKYGILTLDFYFTSIIQSCQNFNSLLRYISSYIMKVKLNSYNCRRELHHISLIGTIL